MADDKRIVYLDIIRGLSILGILFVNAAAFNMPMQVYVNPALSPLGMTPADITVWWIGEVFFTNKFITIFSMLFGISLFLISAKDPDSAVLSDSVIGRRLGWMAIFGLIHGALIWYGDILLLYAISGLVFYSWRNLKARQLLVAGGLLFVMGNALILFPSLGPSLERGTKAVLEPSQPEAFTDVIARMQSGFEGSLGMNFEMWGYTIINEILFYLPVTIGLMMLGLGLFKAGVFKGQSQAATYMSLIAAGLASLILIGWQTSVIVAEGFPAAHLHGLYAIANELLSIFVSLGYVSTLILIAKTDTGLKLLAPLRDAGRMAFTNYLMQSVIMTMIFYGGRAPENWGLGWYGTLSQADLVPVVVSVWVGQLLFSSLWMRLFRYGPFEWVWRSLSHQKLMPILK